MHAARGDGHGGLVVFRGGADARRLLVLVSRDNERVDAVGVDVDLRVRRPGASYLQQRLVDGGDRVLRPEPLQRSDHQLRCVLVQLPFDHERLDPFGVNVHRRLHRHRPGHMHRGLLEHADRLVRTAVLCVGIRHLGRIVQ